MWPNQRIMNGYEPADRSRSVCMSGRSFGEKRVTFIGPTERNLTDHVTDYSATEGIIHRGKQWISLKGYRYKFRRFKAKIIPFWFMILSYYLNNLTLRQTSSKLQLFIFLCYMTALLWNSENGQTASKPRTADCKWLLPDFLRLWPKFGPMPTRLWKQSGQ